MRGGGTYHARGLAHGGVQPEHLVHDGVEVGEGAELLPCGVGPGELRELVAQCLLLLQFSAELDEGPLCFGWSGWGLWRGGWEIRGRTVMLTRTEFAGFRRTVGQLMKEDVLDVVS